VSRRRREEPSVKGTLLSAVLFLAALGLIYLAFASGALAQLVDWWFRTFFHFTPPGAALTGEFA